MKTIIPTLVKKRWINSAKLLVDYHEKYQLKLIECLMKDKNKRKAIKLIKEYGLVSNQDKIIVQIRK
jgi:hypothetical protein